MSHRQPRPISAPEMPYCKIPRQFPANGFLDVKTASRIPCQGAPLQIRKPLIGRAIPAILRLGFEFFAGLSLPAGKVATTRTPALPQLRLFGPAPRPTGGA